jgi:hypothetical protein
VETPRALIERNERLVGALLFYLWRCEMADKKKKRPRKQEKKKQEYSTYEYRCMMGEFGQKLERHKGAFRRK